MRFEHGKRRSADDASATILKALLCFSGQNSSPHEHESMPGDSALRPERAQVGGLHFQLTLPAVDYEFKIQVAGVLTKLFSWK